VTDLAGNETVVERTVTVTAVEPTFGGVPPTRTVVEGEEFDELAGVSAKDANGVDLTDRIEVELVQAASAARMVGPSAGAYALVYTVTDDYGTTAVAQSAVTVVPPADPTDPGTGAPGTPGDGGVVAPGDGTDAGDGTLPATGGEASLLWMLGILALLAGAGLMTRRRNAQV
jgi:LPXTG-motif cell wall-anchored protein